MHFDSGCRLTIILLLLSLSSAASAQPSAAEVKSAGLLRSEVTLDFRAAAVSVRALPIDDSAPRVLLSATGGGADRPVRVASLEIDATMEIGNVALELEEPGPRDPLPLSRYDLWLTRADDSWSLVVTGAQEHDTSEPADDDTVGTLRLTHRNSDTMALILTGGIVATGQDGGRLMLEWGRHVWTADVRFTIPRERPRPRRESGVGDDRTFAFDTTALQRNSRLTRRNTLTVTLPDGSQVGTVYPKNLLVEDRDFAHLVSVATDAVVRMTAGAVIRLDTNVPLEFGDVTLETGNVGLPGSPGAYGVWLKRGVDSWRLVFNDEPDAWGTQHDPVFDVAEIDLHYAYVDDSSRAMSVSVMMTSADQGRFVLVWGPHEWTAGFTIAT